MIDLDWLRWEAERIVAVHGLTDWTAAVAWGLRSDWMWGHAVAGVLDSERLMVEPGRQSRSREPVLVAVRWMVAIPEEWVA